LLNKQLLKYMGVGLVLVAAAVFFIVYIQEGAHIQIKGEVLKVRSIPADQASSIAIIDFRFVNPADYPFIVRRIEVSLEDQNERTFDGYTISDVDAKRLFEYYPVLGQKFNESLVIRTKIEPKQSMDRMLAVRFDVPKGALEARKKLQIRVEDVDGAVSEIVEEKE
jgi:hypothetical protein